MSLGGIVHFGIDMTLVAIVLSAVRRNTGYVFAYENYSWAKLIYGYLGFGEFCYKCITKYVTGSNLFRKQLKDQDRFMDDVEEVEDDVELHKKRRRSSRVSRAMFARN
ncbi:Mco12p KNAG_0H00210 [Huiozyma naganishii CBS 8797]|uniref:DUF1748-domain-containing protein n=1 Tax=Huiozyma naganishii (strain ATCC MYA-139 / BCRC 22969 / CBS 8797 / KCTC 17520 / NBRC 10181 / NCYC 3082 / Yp74L-3) TaxID=1071383 RepID=J7S1F5_HUIN7|nr:hypothetical protein KNAG_0H00210 [Kazachstania naganishii CBS 8797]CCK71437.1 hypothetical protein KNAG_0H00210 [Kazachstania naganishii CBS 8797]